MAVDSVFTQVCHGTITMVEDVKISCLNNGSLMLVVAFCYMLCTCMHNAVTLSLLALKL